MVCVQLHCRWEKKEKELQLEGNTPAILHESDGIFIGANGDKSQQPEFFLP